MRGRAELAGMARSRLETVRGLALLVGSNPTPSALTRRNVRQMIVPGPSPGWSDTRIGHRTDTRGQCPASSPRCGRDHVLGHLGSWLLDVDLGRYALVPFSRRLRMQVLRSGSA